jgi:prepilin-type N-terminal cleavage/methylation domain-containing protein
MTRPRRPSGFTLIEVTAVVLLTGILIGFTTNFYLDLSRASTAAVERGRNARRAVVLLDRVARDLEAAVLVKKPGPVDPLAHPWLFVAESDDPDLGATRIKFTSHGRRPRSPDAVESDFEMVAWMLEPTDRDDFELRRWSSPRLPEGRDLAFPPLEETEPVAGRIASFGIFLLDEKGGRVARWDSTALVESSELPISAEIQVSFFAGDEGETIEGPYVRFVALPVRPLDVEQQLAAAGAGQDPNLDSDGDGIPDAEEDEDGDGIPDGEEDEDGDGVPDAEQDGGETAEEDAGGMTVAECIALNPQIFAALPPELQSVAQSMGGMSMSQAAAQLAGAFPIPANCR